MLWLFLRSRWNLSGKFSFILGCFQFQQWMRASSLTWSLSTGCRVPIDSVIFHFEWAWINLPLLCLNLNWSVYFSLQKKNPFPRKEKEKKKNKTKHQIPGLEWAIGERRNKRRSEKSLFLCLTFVSAQVEEEREDICVTINKIRKIFTAFSTRGWLSAHQSSSCGSFFPHDISFLHGKGVSA